ncbi:MAG: hypothetical protein ACK5LK_04345 [Chthoniobacterales bacterium]
MSFLEKFHRYFRSHEIPFAHWEILFIRFVFAWLIYTNLPGWIPFTEQPKPDALAHWIDFTFLVHTPLYQVLWWAAVAALMLYVLGLFQVVALSYLSILFISIGTLENSQGAAEHYRQLIHWTRILIAGIYLTTAITKLDRSDGKWLWNTPNLSVQIIKTHANDFANTGIPPDPFYFETLPSLIADNPHLARIFFAPGLLLELFLFLGLISRTWSLVMGASIILLHRGIEWLMGLNFATHEWLIWIFFINIPYWTYRIFRYLRSLIDNKFARVQSSVFRNIFFVPSPSLLAPNGRGVLKEACSH